MHFLSYERSIFPFQIIDRHKTFSKFGQNMLKQFTIPANDLKSFAALGGLIFVWFHALHLMV